MISQTFLILPYIPMLAIFFETFFLVFIFVHFPANKKKLFKNRCKKVIASNWFSINTLKLFSSILHCSMCFGINYKTCISHLRRRKNEIICVWKFRKQCEILSIFIYFSNIHRNFFRSVTKFLYNDLKNCKYWVNYKCI